MSFTLTNQQVHKYEEVEKKASFIVRFLKWAEKEDEDNHVTWVGISIAVAAAVTFPVTMLAILLNGAFFGLIIAAMAALALVVVTNLAALPTKYTIPFLFLSVLIDIAIIVTSFFVS